MNQLFFIWTLLFIYNALFVYQHWKTDVHESDLIKNLKVFFYNVSFIGRVVMLLGGVISFYAMAPITFFVVIKSQLNQFIK